MNKTVLVIIAVAALGALAYLLSAGQPDAAKPQPSGGGETSLTGGLQNQIDFKIKAPIVAKIASGINDLNILLASGADMPRGQASLDAVKALEAEVATARANLVAGGETNQQVDAWLAKSRWAELQDLAAKVRKARDQAQQ